MNQQNFSLFELLQSRNKTIKRNAISIYKEISKTSCQHTAQVGDDYKLECLDCGAITKIRENPYDE